MSGVLCSGNIVSDTLAHPAEDTAWGTTTPVETIERHIGGNGANTSIALAALGARVRLLGAVGDDEEGRALVAAPRRAGVETGAIETVRAATAATAGLVNPAGGRKFFHRIGAGAEAFASGIDFTLPLIDGMSHYRLASIFLLPKLRPAASVTLARACAAGLATSLDTNRDSEGAWMRDPGPCLPCTDVIFINEDEARMAAGFADCRAAACVLLERGARTAAMKLGARGCAIFSAAGEIRCPAFDVQAKDTTGAGDCFVAGFLAGRRRGKTLAEAGEFANAVGALNVQRVGGAAGVPSFEAVEAWMRTARRR